ncbi:PspA/IM30 family protein [Aciduricibacillus chroicocephali]|uniref:PspA/IM30 family protein n=1 Tax=Aciduricibacillus chroicocephali TaxID=3054939 RepID=A0ABY9KYC6_9BACI|nr:PspA/IM30 family protein [Bacillaceae bacterium 44XB]
MSILKRFTTIMSSNINSLLDKAEDPAKMVDQYLRDLNSDLGKVKAETASVMAEEQRSKRELDECTAEIDKMQKYAVKALQAGNEDDARKFLERKNVYTTKQQELQSAYELASTNAKQMREMHDKLVKDIGQLESRRQLIKSKAAVAKTQQRINNLGSSASGASDTMGAFSRMEERVNRSLDEANAMAELNRDDTDDIKDLTAKYDDDKNPVEDELEALKRQLAEDKE